MITKLAKFGEEFALILDQEMMAALEIDADSEINVTIETHRIIIEKWTEADRHAEFNQAMEETFEQHKELFRRLAK